MNKCNQVGLDAWQAQGWAWEGQLLRRWCHLSHLTLEVVRLGLSAVNSHDAIDLSDIHWQALWHGAPLYPRYWTWSKLLDFMCFPSAVLRHGLLEQVPSLVDEGTQARPWGFDAVSCSSATADELLSCETTGSGAAQCWTREGDRWRKKTKREPFEVKYWILEDDDWILSRWGCLSKRVMVFGSGCGRVMKPPVLLYPIPGRD